MQTRPQLIAWSGTLLTLTLLQGCATTRSTTSPAGNPVPLRELNSDERALELLRAKPAWLLPMELCPADIAPPQELERLYLAKDCAPDLAACVSRCGEGDGNACFGAALRLQELQGVTDFSERLYLRACGLGLYSGCTNRAAGISQHEPARVDGKTCVARTYQLMCDRKDAWACTMLGLALIRGEGVQKDLDRALEVLPGGCRFGYGDLACQDALYLIQTIEQIKRSEMRTPPPP